MVSFNFYFAGPGCPEAFDEINNLGGLRLFSYLNDKQSIRKCMEIGKPIFLDSGAYTAHTKGKVIDVDEYITYINEHDEHFLLYAQLDTIPGEFQKPKTEEQLLRAPEESWENYLYMAERVKTVEKLLPIFHQGEDFKHLIRMLEHKPRIEYIGISPANDMATPVKAKWIAEVFRIIKKSSNPNVKTHAFGMTSLKVLEKFPFTSADSTTWVRSASLGEIITKFGRFPISTQTLKDKRNVWNMGKEFIKALEIEVAKYGVDLKRLSEEYSERQLLNVRYLHEWSQNYQLKEKKVKQHKLF